MSRKKVKNIQEPAIFELKKDLMRARFKTAFGETVSSSVLRNLKKQIAFLKKSD